jgi:hypothetical protein
MSEINTLVLVVCSSLLLLGFIIGTSLTPSFVFADITGITQFVVTNDNGLYKARFSLTDENNAFVASDGKLGFVMTEFNYNKLNAGFANTTYANELDNKVVYHSLDNIKAYDFRDIQLIYSGSTFLGYTWQIKPEWIQNYTKVCADDAFMVFTLPDGKQLKASTPIYYTRPSYEGCLLEADNRTGDVIP